MPPFKALLKTKVKNPRGRLTVQAMDDSTRIEILDGNLRPIHLDQNLGDVSIDLPMGVYVLRFHRGTHFVEKLVAVTPAAPHVGFSLSDNELPQFVAAAPVSNTTTSHEWQSGPAKKLSQSVPLPPPSGHQGGSHLLIFLRDPFQSSTLPSGITLHDVYGQKLVDLDSVQDRNPNEHWAGAHLSLDPGAYRLRRALKRGGSVEQMVYTCPRWQTQLFLMTTEGGTDILRSSILMSRPEVGFDFDREDLRWTESALRALEGNSNIPGSVRTEMLWAKFDNPMLGIYAALLHLRRPKIDAGLMGQVFRNLYALVGGLPDILAIGWGAGLANPRLVSDAQTFDKLHTPSAFATPPMLMESWKHLRHASVNDNDLIPVGSLSDRIGGRLTSGSPWVTWLGTLPASETISMPSAEDTAIATRMLESGAHESFMTRQPSASRPGSWSKVRDYVYDAATGLAEGARKKTLRFGVPALSDMLNKYPESRFWLRTKRFSELERRMAYWLEPSVDARWE